MSVQGIPVHEEHLFTTAAVAGRTYLITEVPSLDPSAGDRGPFRWALFGPDGIGPIKGATRFRVRRTTTRTETDFVFRRMLGGHMEFRGSDGSIAHVYPA